MKKTKFCKAIILQLKKKIKEKTQRTAKVGLAFSVSLCQIPLVLTYQTKMLVLLACITDENRDTEVEHLAPAHTAAESRAENWTPVVKSGVQTL